MLSINNLHASVEGKSILKGLSLEVKAGEIHAIMGPNGSGKSTLSQVLAGRQDYTVTDGSVQWLEQDLLAMPIEERARSGLFLAFQYPIEIPGVSNAYFLRAAVNAARRHQGLPELDAMDFIKKVKAEDTAESRNACGRVGQWRARVARDYLRSWAAYLDDGRLTEATVELAARSIVSHMRSLGYSRTHLRGWISDRGPQIGIAGLAREAARNLQGQTRTFRFVVASTHLGRVARFEGGPAGLYSEVRPEFESAVNA